MTDIAFASLQLVDVAVEALELGEEAHVERIAVEDADGVVRVDRRDQPVAGVGNRLEMARRNVAGNAGQREVPHPCASRGSARAARCRQPLSATARSVAASFGALTRSE